jgi:hypothetical protein
MISLLGKKTKVNHIRRLQKDDFQLMLIVGLVSIACVGVFLLPSEIRNMLKVRHAVFNPIAYITASFVHDDSLHLGLNLSAFLLATFLLYFINKRISEQKYFLFSLLIMFVALPLLNYGILFYFGIYKSIEFGFGLSLVDSGLIGFTIPSLILYFKRKLEKFNSILFFTSMVLFTFSLISFPYAWSFEFPLPVFCVILGFVFGILEIKRILSFLISSLKQRKTLLESSLVVFTLWFYFFSIVGLFPSTIVSQGGIVDIVSHYFGLLFGIVIFSFYNIAKSITRMKKSEIIRILKGIYVIVRLRKLESLSLLAHAIAIVFFTSLFIVRLIDFNTFIGSIVTLSITATLLILGLAESRFEANVISSVAQYMLKGDISLIDDLLGKFISGKWEITASDPAEGFFAVLEDVSRHGSYEMRRRISEALPALFRWRLDKAENLARILRHDWDDDWKTDIRRRVVESTPFLLSKKAESATFFLDYHEKDEIFTAMAIVEVAHEWLRSDRKKMEEFFVNFKSKVQQIYSAEEIEGLAVLNDIMKTISANTFEAVKKMEDLCKSKNVYVRIAVARHIPSVFQKFPDSAFNLMECFLKPEEHENVRRPIAKENCTKAIINALKDPRLKNRAESILWKLFKDSDEIIRITAFDLVDELMTVDLKLCQDIVNFVADNEKNEHLQRRARRLQALISRMTQSSAL